MSCRSATLSWSGSWRSSGDPVVLVQTVLTADEFGLLADQPALRNGFRTVLY